MVVGLLGQSDHTIDAKGRLIIPIRLREALGARFVMCYGTKDDLRCYPMAEWEKFVTELEAMSEIDEDVEDYVSYFISSATIMEMDSQYRVVIPQAIREELGLEKELTISGMPTYVRISNKVKYHEERKKKSIQEIRAAVNEKLNQKK